MTVSKIASTVILTTSFAIFFLFAFLFCLFGDLKESLSITASFFGGITTLVAAYIATQLFNDWREQHNKAILANEAKVAFKKLSKSFLLLATYNQTVKKFTGQNTTFTMPKIRDSLKTLIDFNQEIATDLKYFEDLTQISEITPLIHDYNNFIRMHLDYIDVYFKNTANQHISQQFIDESTILVEELADLSHSLKDILRDYILA